MQDMKNDSNRENRKRWRILPLWILLLLFVLSGKVAATEYLPGGMSFGVHFSAHGVPVAGVTDVIVGKENGKELCESPAADCGILPGDLLLSVNGQTVGSAAEVADAITDSEGKPLLLRLERGGKTMHLTLRPAASEPDGIYRAGMWLRDSAAGIGTVTLIDTESGAFAGLGHGVCDSESGKLLSLTGGSISEVCITGAEKGVPGQPGQLRGSFWGHSVGWLRENAGCGVFGVLSGEGMTAIGSRGIRTPMPVAASLSEVKTGKATILTTVGEDGVSAYEISIEKIADQRDENKHFLLRVTDEKLLAATGGIVQGMSGSPVLQNGKIVGAVTHVLVDDPTCGYGIFIGKMLEHLPAS